MLNEPAWVRRKGFAGLFYSIFVPLRTGLKELSALEFKTER
jgi:hypothetical protein